MAETACAAGYKDGPAPFVVQVNRLSKLRASNLFSLAMTDGLPSFAP